MSRAESVRWAVGLMVCALAVGCVPAGGDGDGDGDGGGDGEDCPAGQSFNPVSGGCEVADGNNANNANNTSGNNTSGNNDNNTNNANTNNTAGNNTSGNNDNNTSGNNTSGNNDNNTNNANTNNANASGETTGTLFGVVTRSAAPAAGGVGGLYLAVFDGDPLSGGQLVANSLIEGADMTAGDVSIAYQIEDIPVRPEDYFVIGFLDDNGTVNPNDESTQRPDRGDLVSLQGFGAPKVTVDSPGETEFDIDLNVNMPF